MERRLRLDALMDLYGPLLTERQRQAMALHADEDLSLAEIAEQEGISRQGVRDALLRAEKTLLALEAKLGWARRQSALWAGLEQLAAALAVDGQTGSAERIRALMAAWEEA